MRRSSLALAAALGLSLAPALSPAVQAQPAFSAPEMVLVRAGSFDMGSASGSPYEAPVHRVTLTRSFLIAKYAITYDDYDAYCRESGASLPEDKTSRRGRHPVQNVTWTEAVDFCNWLSIREGLTPCYSGKGKLTACDFDADGYRLPTEAEWEYAARGGHLGGGLAYAGSDDPDDTAWYGGNSGGLTHPIGLKAPNPLGLYDMCGNLFQFCWDWYAPYYYKQSPEVDPLGGEPSTSRFYWDWIRSRRGGSWREGAEKVAVWSRSQDGMKYVGDNTFRLVRTVVPSPEARAGRAPAPAAMADLALGDCFVLAAGPGMRTVGRRREAARRARRKGA